MKHLLFSLLLSGLVNAAPVINLGKARVKGKMRGPSVELFESGHLDAVTATRATLAQLTSLEDILTRPVPPPGLSAKGSK